MDLLTQVRRTVARWAMLTPGETVLTAVSGGADSVALLSMLSRLSREMDLRLVVAHLNHGLRSEAEEDAAFVADLAQRLGWPWVYARADVRGHSEGRGISLEEAGREARYAFFEEAAARHGAQRIALGHHRRDQAETILHHLGRGSGLSGLRGMRPVRGAYIRPLLYCSREAIEAYLEGEGLRWRHDASNDDLAFLRNRTRHRVLPVLREHLHPRIEERLGRLADIAALEDDYLDGAARGLLAEATVAEGVPMILDIPILAGRHAALRHRALHLALLRFSPVAGGVSTVHVEALAKLVTQPEPDGIAYGPYQTVARREGNRLILFRHDGPGRWRRPDDGSPRRTSGKLKD